MHTSHHDYGASNRHLLRVLKAACAGERLQRALDAAAQLRLERSFAIAVKIAETAGATALAERVEELAARRADGDAAMA